MRALVAAGLDVGLVPRLDLRSQRHRGVVTRLLAPSCCRDVSTVTTHDLLRLLAVAPALTAPTEVVGPGPPFHAHTATRRRGWG